MSRGLWSESHVWGETSVSGTVTHTQFVDEKKNYLPVLSRYPQDGSSAAQDGPSAAQDGPSAAQDGSSAAQDGPSAAQDGP